jgi:hypothetical protein
MSGFTPDMAALGRIPNPGKALARQIDELDPAPR